MTRIRKKATPCTLVTGFSAFDGETINPSLEVARALHNEVIASHRIVGAELSTEFSASLPMLASLVDEHRPALVIALGQAGGRSEIALERVAINLIDARIKDNAGAQPVDRPVIDNAPNAYFSTLPLKAMLARLHAAGIPSTLSLSAGSFVCNQVFFGLLHALAERDPSIRGGFIHLPYLPQQAAKFASMPSMTLQTMTDAVRLCVDTALTTHADPHYAAGTMH